MEWVGGRNRKARSVSGQVAFSKFSAVSLVGGRPVGMGIDIVTTRGYMLSYGCRDIHSARELDRYFLIQIVQSALRPSLHSELACGVPGVDSEKVQSRVSGATSCGGQRRTRFRF